MLLNIVFFIWKQQCNQNSKGSAVSLYSFVYDVCLYFILKYITNLWLYQVYNVELLWMEHWHSLLSVLTFSLQVTWLRYHCFTTNNYFIHHLFAGNNKNLENLILFNFSTTYVILKCIAKLVCDWCYTSKTSWWFSLFHNSINILNLSLYTYFDCFRIR